MLTTAPGQWQSLMFTNCYEWEWENYQKIIKICFLRVNAIYIKGKQTAKDYKKVSLTIKYLNL